MHGFLGPNGAGKSTTIRILLGLLRADGGTATVLGRDPWRDATDLHRRLAYVPGDVVLWPSLSGGEVIDLLGRLRGGIDEGRRRRLVDRFELDETKKGKAYSKGNRQKVALVAALASGVPLLVLDEPTAGLDPLMEEVFQERAHRPAGRRAHRAAVEPHPQRGRARLRPGEHRARRADRRLGQPRRAAPPHPHPGARRAPSRRSPRARSPPGPGRTTWPSTAPSCAARSTPTSSAGSSPPSAAAGSPASPASRPPSRSSSSPATRRRRSGGSPQAPQSPHAPQEQPA